MLTLILVQGVVAATSPTGPDFNLFLQYGVLGLVVVGFVTGWIVPGHQAKALAAENARLTALLEQKALPMIERSAVAIDSLADVLERSTEALNRRTVEETIEARQRRSGQ